MVMGMNLIGYVHCFLIVINSDDPRFNQQLQNTLRLFKSMYGVDFFKNAMICLTRYSFSQAMISQREKKKNKQTYQ